MLLKYYFKNRFFGNLNWMLLSSISQMIISVLINSFVARYLGPDNYGVLHYVSSFITIFTPICQLGLYSIVINELVISENPKEIIIGSALFLRLILGVSSTILIVILISSINNFNKLFIEVAWLSSIQLVFQASDIFKYWYQSQLQYKKVAIVSVTSYLLTSIYRIYLLVGNKSVVWFSSTVSIDYLMIFIGLYIFYRKDRSPRIKPSIKYIRILLSRSKNLFLSSIIVGIGSQVGTILLKHLMSENMVGYYTSALTCCGILAFIPGSLIDSARPILMETKKRSQQEYLKRMSMTLSGVTIIGGLAVIGTLIFANLIIRILFGEQYLSAVLPLRICVIGFYLSYYGVVRKIWFVCEDKLKYERTFSIISSLFSLTISYFLIKKLGLIGASINYILNQFMMNVLLTSLYRNTSEFNSILYRGISFKDINLKTFFNSANSNIS